MPDTTAPLLWLLAAVSACVGLIVSNHPTPNAGLPGFYSLPWWQDISAHYDLVDVEQGTPAFPAADCITVTLQGEGAHRRVRYELTCAPSLLFAGGAGKAAVLQLLPSELFVDPYELEQSGQVLSGTVRASLFGPLDLEHSAPAKGHSKGGKISKAGASRSVYAAAEVPFHTKYPSPVHGGRGCSASVLSFSLGPYVSVPWPAPLLLLRTGAAAGGAASTGEAGRAPSDPPSVEPPSALEYPSPAAVASVASSGREQGAAAGSPSAAAAAQQGKGSAASAPGGPAVPGPRQQWAVQAVTLRQPPSLALPAGCSLHAGWVGAVTLLAAVLASGAVVAAALCGGCDAATADLLGLSLSEFDSAVSRASGLSGGASFDPFLASASGAASVSAPGPPSAVSACVGLIVSNHPTPNAGLPGFYSLPWWQDISAHYDLVDVEQGTPAFPAADCITVTLQGEGAHRRVRYELTCAPSLLFAGGAGKAAVLQLLPSELFVDPYELEQSGQVLSGTVRASLFGPLDLEQPAPACRPTVLSLDLRNISQQPLPRVSSAPAKGHSKGGKISKAGASRSVYAAAEVPFHTKYPSPVHGGRGCSASVLSFSLGPYVSVPWPAPLLLLRTGAAAGGAASTGEAGRAPSDPPSVEPPSALEYPSPAAVASVASSGREQGAAAGSPSAAAAAQQGKGSAASAPGGPAVPGPRQQWAVQAVTLRQPPSLALPAGCSLHAGWVGAVTLLAAVLASGAVVAAALW
ncbi:hypothetical protein HYH03_001267 [Edaphochlamys debaryana]|uniref:Uncharacterized protein n=1 Tax=Edaphochlamys debaryana TaxID=47281 RepID=A0A836C635_9CHLO|nr:hypothetical protein HYH03_001267 [Edaphochlamys debaryana]|eukprot:KAG2501490.1 hypothetical protein HYH03_001267 [Edaphochlamys debaryana]